MAVPKKKISKHKSRTRHSTRQTVNMIRMENKFQLTKCSNCGKPKLSHRVCLECGHYKGKQVLNIKVKDKTKVIDA